MFRADAVHRAIELGSRVITIGRGTQNDIVLDDPDQHGVAVPRRGAAGGRPGTCSSIWAARTARGSEERRVDRVELRTRACRWRSGRTTDLRRYAARVRSEWKRRATIGRYEVIERVGRGGMGVLYRGRDPVLDREVAIKVMAGDFSADESARARFFREARAAARLQHRNIVTIFEFAEDNGTPYIAMEFLRGRSLAAAHAERAAAHARAEARHPHAAADRAALRARAGHRPPRREAAEHLADRRRHHQAARLRHREDRRVDDDQRGEHPRQRLLHGARAGHRPRDGRPRRHVRQPASCSTSCSRAHARSKATRRRS